MFSLWCQKSREQKQHLSAYNPVTRFVCVLRFSLLPLGISSALTQKLCQPTNLLSRQSLE
uniref:Uncharacterized protein n=1 Tax=Anguilla anguilla TaxID=7936 RepID=A0A0E9S348_ANGAN